MLRWVTIAENQLKLWITSSGRQPAATRSVTATRARLAMPHLLGPAALEQRFDGRGLRPARGDEDPELVVGKARMVRDGGLMPRREQDRCGRRVEDRGQRVAELHACLAAARRGAGSSSLTSATETAGKFFTNRRNHMKNQPKLPAMMPQSAQVAL